MGGNRDKDHTPSYRGQCDGDAAGELTSEARKRHLDASFSSATVQSELSTAPGRHDYIAKTPAQCEFAIRYL
jgi:hypothetical protein